MGRVGDDGAEERGIEVFNEALGLLGRMQQDGTIEKFDVALLAPNSDLARLITCGAPHRRQRVGGAAQSARSGGATPSTRSSSSTAERIDRRTRRAARCHTMKTAGTTATAARTSTRSWARIRRR